MLIAFLLTQTIKYFTEDLWNILQLFSAVCCKKRMVAYYIVTLQPSQFLHCHFSEFERRGIDAGEQKCLALVRRARGSRKSFNGQHIVTERCYADCDGAFPVSLSLLVQVSLFFCCHEIMEHT